MATTTLKILRKVKGYKQEQVADVLGIGQNTYSRLERNPKSLTAKQAQKLADVYKVNIEDLLSEATPVLTFPELSTDDSNSSYSNHPGNQNKQQEYIEDIKSLKEEIEYLRKQNFELIRALRSR